MLSKKCGPSTYRYVKHKHSTCRRLQKPYYQKKYRCHNYNYNYNYITNQIKYDKLEKAIKHKDPVNIAEIICANGLKIEEQIKKIISESIKELVVEETGEPIKESVEESIVELTEKPVVEPVEEQVEEPIEEPVVEPIVEPVVKPVRESVEKPVVVVEPIPEIKDIVVKKKRTYVIRKAKNSWKWLKSWVI